jgi:succinoglycan biosynthesis protein ExoL
MKKMVFISNNWCDAHQQLRLNALSEFDLTVACLAFRRAGHPIKSTFSYTELGNISNGKYLKRLFRYFCLILKLPNATKSTDFTYIYGFDLFLITLIYRKLSGRNYKIVFEITDIREVFFSKRLVGKFARWLEELSIANADLLVVTSKEYVTEYFEKCRHISVSRYLVIENKLHRRQKNTNPLPALDPKAKIRIGYFGYLRCPSSFECLLTLADYHQFEIIVAGIFTEATEYYKSQLIHHPAINYLGSFDGIRGMSDLYHQIDYVWAVYPFSIKRSGNHRWARTNRFYESLYFEKPAILQKASADARRSDSLGGMAVVIDLADIQDAVKLLLKQLNHDNLIELRERIVSVFPSNYLITSEYEELALCLNLTKL